MGKPKMDVVQLGLLLIAGIGLLGGFWSYCEGHFAKTSDLQTEVDERRELKQEVDQMYYRSVPREEQIQLRYHRKIPNGS